MPEQQQEVSAIDSSQDPVQDKMTQFFWCRANSVECRSDWVGFNSTAVSMA